MTGFGRSIRPDKKNVCGCPGYLQLKLRCDDYYPALGAKTIVVRGELAGRVPMDSGKIRAELVYPYPSLAIYQKIHILQPEADMRAGRAEFTLRADPDVTPQDLAQIEIKFTYLVNDNDNGSVQGTWKVHNNSNVKMGEVLAGQAVFVFDNRTGPNHEGKTPANVNVDDERYFDFVQELLNQVAPRKRSMGNLYTFLDENGIFSRDLENPENNTLQALYYLKEHFHIDNTSNPLWDFTKLMRDYNIPEADYLMWTNKIVDKRTFAGDTLRVEVQPLDNLINPSNTQGDTGLYELYVNVVKRFVDRMIEEGETYRNYQARAWRSRNNIQQGPGIVDGNGMSYCFGCKDTVQSFEDFVSGCTVPQKLTIPNNYRGNLNPNTCQIQAGQTYQYPGLWEDELDVSGTTTQYWPTYWSGIDCSGFAQRMILEARAVYQNNLGLNIDVKNFVFDHNTETISGEIGHAGFFIDNRVLNINLPQGNSQQIIAERNRLLSKLKRGDLIHYSGHITTVNSERANLIGNQVRYQIIHAYGSPSYTYPIYDPHIPNTVFSRKVVVTWQDAATPIGFGRIKIWN